MRMYINRIAKFALPVIVLFLIPSVLTTQTAQHDYHVVLGEKSEIIQKGLQEAADRGYRLVPGQDGWPLIVLEKPTGDVEPIDYLLLGARKAATMQKQMDEASAQGYRFASILGFSFKSIGMRGVADFWAGTELLLVMQREKGKAARTHEQKVLATQRPKTLQTELNAEGQKGFRLVGQANTGSEWSAVLERPLQSVAPHEYLIPWSSWSGWDPHSIPKIADGGYQVIAGQGRWNGLGIFEKSTSEAESPDYLFLDIDYKVAKMQKKVDEASARGYRFLAFLIPYGLVMQREKGKTAHTYETKILSGSKMQPLEKDLLAEAQKGFHIAGMNWVSDIWIIMERSE